MFVLLIHHAAEAEGVHMLHDSKSRFVQTRIKAYPVLDVMFSCMEKKNPRYLKKNNNNLLNLSPCKTRSVSLTPTINAKITVMTRKPLSPLFSPKSAAVYSP